MNNDGTEGAGRKAAAMTADQQVNLRAQFLKWFTGRINEQMRSMDVIVRIHYCCGYHSFVDICNGFTRGKLVMMETLCVKNDSELLCRVYCV